MLTLWDLVFEDQAEPKSGYVSLNRVLDGICQHDGRLRAIAPYIKRATEHPHAVVRATVSVLVLNGCRRSQAVAAVLGKLSHCCPAIVRHAVKDTFHQIHHGVWEGHALEAGNPVLWIQSERLDINADCRPPRALDRNFVGETIFMRRADAQNFLRAKGAEAQWQSWARKILAANAEINREIPLQRHQFHQLMQRRFPDTSREQSDRIRDENAPHWKNRRGRPPAGQIFPFEILDE